jgi:hypothetical protein
MTATTSPKRLLAETLYPGDLPADVDQWVTEGRSWRWIATHVSNRLATVPLTISHETLRQWYAAKDPAPASG